MQELPFPPLLIIPTWTPVTVNIISLFVSSEHCDGNSRNKEGFSLQKTKSEILNYTLSLKFCTVLQKMQGHIMATNVHQAKVVCLSNAVIGGKRDMHILKTKLRGENSLEHKRNLDYFGLTIRFANKKS